MRGQSSVSFDPLTLAIRAIIAPQSIFSLSTSPQAFGSSLSDSGTWQMKAILSALQPVHDKSWTQVSEVATASRASFRAACLLFSQRHHGAALKDTPQGHTSPGSSAQTIPSNRQLTCVQSWAPPLTSLVSTATFLYLAKLHLFINEQE